MLTQTWAIFYDSYRDLNSRKLFWIVLILSGLVVAACAVPYVDEKGFWLLGWRVSEEPNTRWLPRALLYKALFRIAIDQWMTLWGTVLALVSVAGLLPDYLAGGAIDLVLSKPISRLRLFLTKYAAGLLFVALQVTIFTVATFLVMGFRGGVWVPRIFVAIPLVLLFFSYLYGVCVFLGVWTRSTVAALLLTLLFWLFLAAVNLTDGGLLGARAQMMAGVELAERRQQHTQPETRAATTPDTSPNHANGDDEFDSTDPDGPPVRRLPRHPDASDLDRERQTLATVARVHRIVIGIKTCLPKTADTVELLGSAMMRAADLPKVEKDTETHGGLGALFGVMANERQRLVHKHVRELTSSRSLLWILGTSLLFEVAAVGLAGRIFCRRDY